MKLNFCQIKLSASKSGRILLKQLIILLSASIFLFSCASTKISKIDNGSIVLISATSSGFGAKSYGVVISLINIKSRKTYESQSFSPISPHSFIQNIPPGKYNVQKVALPVGSITYSNWSDSVKTFFGEIKIEANSKYYMGNFSCKRTIGRSNVLTMRIDGQDIPEKILEKIEGVNTGWKNGDFVKLYPYASNELLIY